MLGSGNLGLISLMEEPRRLTLEEIDERHPRLIPALRAHPHVGWVLVRSAERGPVVLGAAGAHYLADGIVEGEDPLARFAPNAPRHLLRTDGFAHVADIMVGSFYDPDLEEGCAFEELISFHGGIGGPQTRPFILYPVGFPLPDEDIVGAEQVHSVLSGWRHMLQGGERAGAGVEAPRMNLVWSVIVIVAVAALAVTAMLLVRRKRARRGAASPTATGPPASSECWRPGSRCCSGSSSSSPSRATTSRESGAETEALVLSQQVETAQFLPAPVAAKLTGELVCYGRSVIHIEWPRAESGDQGDAINPWGVTLFRTFKTFQPKTPSEEAAYGKWIDQTSDREAARIDRIHGAVGVIPTPLWLVLLLISGVVFVFMLFFADRAEGAVTQAVMMGSVAIVVASMLLLIAFLDSPFQEGVGGVRPVAMERTLRIIDQALQAVGGTVQLPCDTSGNPRP